MFVSSIVTFQILLQNNLVQVPDLIHILLDGTIGGELAGACHLEDGALCPACLVQILHLHSLLRIRVGLEVLEDEVCICL